MSIDITATDGTPLRRCEGFSGRGSRSSKLLDENLRILPPGRYYKLISEWIWVDEDV